MTRAQLFPGLPYRARTDISGKGVHDVSNPR